MFLESGRGVGGPGLDFDPKSILNLYYKGIQIFSGVPPPMSIYPRGPIYNSRIRCF